MYGQKTRKTNIFKTGCNTKFCSFIGPVPIIGILTPLPGMQFWNVVHQNELQFKRPPRAAVELATPLRQGIPQLTTKLLFTSSDAENLRFQY